MRQTLLVFQSEQSTGGCGRGNWSIFHWRSDALTLSRQLSAMAIALSLS